jgi:hypothetical protein
MTPGRRLLDFGFVCLTAAVIWAGAQWLLPYFELVAPVGAFLIFLVVVSLGHALWFAIQHRSRLVVRRAPLQGQPVVNRGQAGRAQSPAIGLRGTQ